MTSRRHFMQLSTVTALMASVGGLSALARTFSASHVFISSHTQRALAFAKVFSSQSTVIRNDLAPAMHRLKALAGAASEGAVIVGLTRDIDHLVLHQLASELGFRDLYYGRHAQCDSQETVHELNGETALVESMARELCRKARPWAESIGSALAQSQISRNLSTRLQTGAFRAVEDLSISWAMRLEGVQA